MKSQYSLSLLNSKKYDSVLKTCAYTSLIYNVRRTQPRVQEYFGPDIKVSQRITKDTRNSEES